jgi:hypothetical protein
VTGDAVGTGTGDRRAAAAAAPTRPRFWSNATPAVFDDATYRPDIDGLRALSVLAVVAFHAAPGWVPGGFVGVDVFFVISGFLISKIIFAETRQGSFSFKRFTPGASGASFRRWPSSSSRSG